MKTYQYFLSIAAFAVVFSLTMVGCLRRQAGEKPPTQINFVALADLIVRQSSLQPGEQVLFVAAPGRFDSLVAVLEQAVARTGAVYLGTISVDSLSQPKSWTTDFVKALAGRSGTDLTAQLGEVDLGIMLPGANTSHKPYMAMQEVLQLGHGRTIHFHWSGAYDTSGQPIEIDSTIDKFYQNVLLDTDYAALKAIQSEFDSAMRSAVVRVTTPAGTNLVFRIGDRPVTKQNGDASLANISAARNLIDREIELPAGAIRVAPLEETVEGTIAFPDGQWNGKPVQGLVLTIAKGKVTKIAARSGQEHVKAELDTAPEAAYAFREMAVGFNPLLAIKPEKPFIPYYGYGAGIVRLSLGDNSELGGNVKGPYVRWNFFTDATVKVDTVTWIRDGKRIK